MRKLLAVAALILGALLATAVPAHAQQGCPTVLRWNGSTWQCG